MSAAAIVARRRRRILRQFRDAGAVDPKHAASLEALGVRWSWIFAKMADRGVFLPLDDGRYYLDELAAEAYLSHKRRVALIGAGLTLAVFLAFWALKLHLV